MNEFSRSELLLGRDGMQALADSTVVVFGIGGVGSHCTEALARGGIGHLVLIDHDTVSLTNLNRQSIAYHSTIGQAKTQVMKARIADINPAARVDTFETFVLPDNLAALLDSVGPISCLVDAIDTVTAKLAIAEYALSRQIPLISSMGTGNKLHAERFVIADIADTSVCPLCRVMRRELKKRGIEHLKVLYSPEPPLTPLAPEDAVGKQDGPDAPGSPDADHQNADGGQTAPASARRSAPGSVSFVPPVAGLLIAGEVIRSLTGR